MSGEQESNRQVSPEAAAEIQSLTNLWSGWREQTKTFKVEGFRFIGLCSGQETAISREEILQLFSDVLVPWHARATASEAVTLDSLDTLPLGTMFPKLPRGALSYDRVGTGWSHFELLEGPDGRRVDHQTLGDQKTIVRRDGKEQKYSSATQQAALLPSEGKERVEKFEDFLYMPSLKPLTRLDVISAERHILTNKTVQHEFTIEVNPLNGFIYHDVRSLADKGYMLERIQDLPFEGADELPIPRLLVQMSYQSAKSGSTFLRKVVFYVITTAAINPDYAREDLQLAVPAGTVIADFENQVPSPTSRTGMGPTARRISEPVKDVLAKAKEVGFRGAVTAPVSMPSPSEQSRPGIARVSLVVLNALVLVAVVVWWRRSAKEIRG